MITTQVAHQLLWEYLPEPTKIVVPLSDCLGRYTAQPIASPIDTPPFDNAAMDGFALAFADYQAGKPLHVSIIIEAGSSQQHELMPTTAARIFTGAPVPLNADTVVMQENCRYNETSNLLWIEPHDFKPGANVRKKGSHTSQGEIITDTPTRLTAGTIGLLASLGISNIEVYKPPIVGIIITGNELVPVGQPISYGQIYESNGITLQMLLQEMTISPPPYHHVLDSLEAISTKIAELLLAVDVLLITGGTSVGSLDYVQTALAQQGVEKVFYKIKQKPGKPLFFGKKGQKSIFALPGNPASVYTCFQVYVRPFLKAMLSGKTEWLSWQSYPLAHQYVKKAGLTHWVKATVKAGELTICEGQESYKMDAFRSANALACLPAERTLFEKGEVLQVLPI